MKLVFATHNNHKVAEIKPLFPPSINIVSLTEIGKTLSENAILKASVIYKELKCNCFADDTGLEVDALNGEPGVYSARYAGEGKSAADNIEKLLYELKGNTNRTAKFKTVIAAIIDDEQFLFEGVVDGIIAETTMGDKGFGYDPVFVPVGFPKSFAQMTLGEKNNLSHRSIAVKKFLRFLEERV